ncbi:hypothetical protein ABN148_19260 [Klebsiella oxytoca]|uniref:hypothetical protein n=1 Tax=Enterobacteriaceae TaxID=543 RepID=UPI000F689C7F|nr:hypothetical protein [Enterobacter chengduensis]RSK60572.1 hypothetical protein EJE23_01775 [Enterobacter chengduensis]
MKIMGMFKNKPPKKHYEVVAFDENGTILYYICLIGTRIKVKPEKPFKDYQEALEACNALSINLSI